MLAITWGPLLALFINLIFYLWYRLMITTLWNLGDTTWKMNPIQFLHTCSNTSEGAAKLKTWLPIPCLGSFISSNWPGRFAWLCGCRAPWKPARPVWDLARPVFLSYFELIGFQIGFRSRSSSRNRDWLSFVCLLVNLSVLLHASVILAAFFALWRPSRSSSGWCVIQYGVNNLLPVNFDQVLVRCHQV